MNCLTNYCDWVSCDDEGDILISTGQVDADPVTAIVTNKQRSYSITTAIVDGNLVIPRSEFPTGWFNPYAGEFVVTMQVGCYDDPLFCGQYESITFTVRNGTGKNAILCPCAAE